MPFFLESVKTARDRYLSRGLIDQASFDALKTIDPSPTKKYLEWMVKMFVEYTNREGGRSRPWWPPGGR